MDATSSKRCSMPPAHVSAALSRQILRASAVETCAGCMEHRLLLVASMRHNLEIIDPYAARAETLWRDLERTSRPAYFLTWGWPTLY